MKKSGTKRLFRTLGAGIFIIIIALLLTNPNILLWDDQSNKSLADKIDTKELKRTEMKAARAEYFFNLLRDPETNKIPTNIRNRELNFAKRLPTANQAFFQAKGKNPALQAIDYNWQAAGPFDVGGRTRALAVDQRDPNTILAGGVSGGMWKSDDGGQNWNLKTPDLPNLSVTSVSQDPQNPDTWYYASGEVLGNSASASNSAPFYGRGIYKSTDNGETWSLMPQASSNVQGLVDTYNTVSRLRVSPTSSTVFISSLGRGIYRSTDGQSFTDEPILGTAGEQLFCDVTVAPDGTVAATISEASFDDQSSQAPDNNHNPGIFVSTNDGQAWVEVTPDDFPDTHQRSVVSFAPTNPDILYVLTKKGATDTSNQGVSFFKIDITDLQNPVSEDRSANLPDFRENGFGTGDLNLQGGYNMALAVKPDDENYVFIGGTNLFRSADGFATTPDGGYDGSNESQKDEYWIGGYSQSNSAALYQNHHPDQHIIAFPQPNAAPNEMWSGHDGGLSFTNNVSASQVSWQDQDNGYITSQFYAADIPAQADDNRFVGGTQDNGSPYFEFGSNSQTSEDISSGDGGYAFFTENYVFVSSQLGRIIRWNKDFSNFAYVAPPNAENQLFIHPYAMDPNDEKVMYYPGGDHIWRNAATDVTNNSNAGSNWAELDGIAVSSTHTITALEVSDIPANILYFAGTAGDAAPELRRMTNAKAAREGATDISLPDEYQQELEGAYVKDIAVNPVNGNEVIVVMSNYNITGLYHTTDGGESWQAIEGNLTGNSNDPGPSLRSATIIPAESGTIYFIGTSTGLYSTQMLDGDQTTWGQEASNTIGNAVTEDLASRVSDGDVAAGTHGRGIFLGSFQRETSTPFIAANPIEGRSGQTITLIANEFEFSPNPSLNTVTLGGVEATVESATTTELEVVVPRNIFDPQTAGETVVVQVTNDNDDSAFGDFNVLPPNDFAILPNYPNPFNPSTTIPFDISQNSQVTLSIYNITGQKVLEPISAEQYNPGTYDVNIDLSGLASGVYIYRLKSETFSGDVQMDSRKMTLIK